MTKNLLGCIPKPGGTVQWREFGSEAILLDPETGEYSQINDTGVVIWKHIDGRNTVQQIVDELVSHFDCAAHDVVDDVSEFMEALAAKRLLVIG